MPRLLLTMIALFLLSCGSNIQKVNKVHVPEGGTDTTDKQVAQREEVSKRLQGVWFSNKFSGGAAGAAGDGGLSLGNSGKPGKSGTTGSCKFL